MRTNPAQMLTRQGSRLHEILIGFGLIHAHRKQGWRSKRPMVA